MGLFGPPNIGRLEAKRNVEGLRKALGYRKTSYSDARHVDSVRKSAVIALARIGDARAVDALIGALHHEDSQVRDHAADALGGIGDARAIDALIGTLHEEHPHVRSCAAAALGRIGDVRAIDALIGALHDEDSHVRGSAADALGGIGDARAIDALISVLHDERSAGRKSAADALDTLGWCPEGDATGAAYWAAKRKWEMCVQIGAPAVDALTVAHHDADREVRKGAVDALGRIGDARTIDALIDALLRDVHDADFDVHKSAVIALGKIGDARVVGGPIAALWCRSWEAGGRELQKYAIDALVQIGAPAVDALIGAVHDGLSDVPERAAEALGRIGDARAIDALIDALFSETLWLPASATQALVQIGAPAVNALIGALHDERPYRFTDQRWHARTAAAYALGQIGETRAVNALVAAAHLALPELLHVPKVAAETLSMMVDADVRRFIDSAANALRQIGDADALRLLDTLRDTAEWRFLDALEEYENNAENNAWQRYDADYAVYEYRLHDPSDAQQAQGAGYPPDPPDFPRPDPPDWDNYRRRYGSCPLCGK